MPLLELMRQAGFTERGFALLAEAKAESDALASTERAAMRWSESARPLDARQQANLMLHDAAYQAASAGIVQRIGTFMQERDRHAQAEVHAAKRTARLMFGLQVAFTLLLFWTVWRSYGASQRILGTTPDALHACIARIGEGDFGTPIAVPAGRAHSVLAWLEQTRGALARLDAQHRGTEARNRRLMQLYTALSQCNQAIVRAADEAELFPQVCRSAVVCGGMKMAWIGMLDAETGALHPVAWHGDGTDYLRGLQISVRADSPFGHGPTGTAMREDRPCWCQDFQNDPATAPWRERGARHAWGALAALPLHRGGKVAGAFNLYAGEAHALDSDMQALLIEMALDIDFALEGFERERQRQRAEGRIQYLARHDALTGLPNRLQLQDHACYAISLAKRSGGGLAMMFLDLDHFKHINDTLGHGVGDALLVEMARRLRGRLREEDMVTRLGGDEFILLLPGTDAPGAAHVAHKLLAAISQPCRIEQYDLTVTASIGIALYPGDGTDLDSLSRSADVAMYRAKQENRNGYRFFTAEMQARSARHLLLGNALRHAVERDQLELHYQPQVDLADGRIVGAEALLRWRHPELGAVSPAEFIPMAEDTGLILPIGAWVLQQAAIQAKSWLDGGIGPLVVAVNLSAVQFRHPDLPEQVARILDEAGLPPQCLELELTEGVATHDPQAAIAIMGRLRELGVRMSLDDFGTGYSSLGYLKKFKLYKLKIDRSFVRDLCTDPEDMAIVSAIIGMAGNLGLKTIAEGVETAEQMQLLRETGCHEGQGYFYSKPLPAAGFAVLAAAGRMTGQVAGGGQGQT